MLIELSDLLHYMEMVLIAQNSSIEELMQINMAKLGARYPNGYSHDKAITHCRDKKVERAAVDAIINQLEILKEGE